MSTDSPPCAGAPPEVCLPVWLGGVGGPQPRRGLGQGDLAREPDQPGLLFAEAHARAAHHVDDHDGEQVQQQVGAAGDADDVGQVLQDRGEDDRDDPAHQRQAGHQLAPGLAAQRGARTQRQDDGQHDRRREQELDHRALPALIRWASMSTRMFTLLSRG
jgi:hypothetical protein